MIRTRPDLLAFLEEDAPCGDITSDAVVKGIQGVATIRTRDQGVIAGLDEARDLFSILDLEVRMHCTDGERVEAGTTLLEVMGAAEAILRAERTALNLIGRMSGIATATRSLVDRVAAINSHCKVAATRKTAPGLRYFDKKAVLLGGGDPHRGTLSDMILIKDNHLSLVPLPEAISRARRNCASSKVEVEVTSPKMALEAARCGVDIVMLDNMAPAMIRDTISLLEQAGLRAGVIIEASGKITEDSIAQYVVAGVDVISVGALTHSVKNFDVTMDIAPLG